MKTASILQTKNQLSALIDQVRQDETIVITDHDQPVAKLVPAPEEKVEKAAGALANLEKKGILRRGNSAGHRVAAQIKPCAGSSALATLLLDRQKDR